MVLMICTKSLEKKKESVDSSERAFEDENLYWIENQNDMTRIQNNEVNKISECNLLHDIINLPKIYKILNIH